MAVFLNKESTMTNIIAQLEAIYHKSLDEMSPDELLTAIEAWRDDGNHLPIIALVDALPAYHNSAELIQESANACLALYRTDPTQYADYLPKSLELYQEIAVSQHADESWNYHVGVAYFLSNDPASAETHLSLAQDFADGHVWLAQTMHALNKGIDTATAKAGGQGGLEYALEDFLDALQTYAPKTFETLNPPADDEEILAFENKLGITLPPVFWTLYRTFNGQKFGVRFCEEETLHRFLSLDEIEMVKQQYIAKLCEHYGDDWHTVQLPKTSFSTEGYPPTDKIKNRLYHPAWLPIAMSEENLDNLDEMGLFCLDLDPSTSGTPAQTIGVYFDELPEFYQVLPSHDELQTWFYTLAHQLEEGILVYDEDAQCLISVRTDHSGHTPDTHFYHKDEQLALESYIEHTFGKIDDVFYEVISLDIECRIYVVAPTPEQPFYTLITGGMGAYAMNTPDLETPARAELVIRVPSHWNLNSNQEKDYWPIRWLKNLARQPLHQNSHLASGHTLTTYTLADTDFEGLLLLEVDTDEHEIACVNVSGDKTVFFYQLVPLYREELQYKLDAGLMALMQRLEEANIPYPPIVDSHRPNVCTDYRPKDGTLRVFDGVFWTFDEQIYETLSEFYEALYEHNSELDNPLLQFDPLQSLYDTSHLYVTYETWLEFCDDLHEHEFLQNPHRLTNKYDDHPQTVNVVGKICGDEPTHIGVLELLWKVHNSLANKQIGERVFFEGFYQVGVISDEDEDVPVLAILLGN